MIIRSFLPVGTETRVKDTTVEPTTTGTPSSESMAEEPKTLGPITTESSDVTTGSELPKGKVNPLAVELHPSDACTNLVTSLAKEVMFFLALVCLFVCLFVDNITQKVMNGLG